MRDRLNRLAHEYPRRFAALMATIEAARDLTASYQDGRIRLKIGASQPTGL